MSQIEEKSEEMKTLEVETRECRNCPMDSDIILKGNKRNLQQEYKPASPT